MHCTKPAYFLIVLLVNFMEATAQRVAGDTLDRINAVFQKWNTNTSPGATLAIARHGMLVFNQAWGMANIEDQVANTTTTLFDAASITKQFTAAGILLLEAKNKLSLNDDIRRFIPELPQWPKPVRIRNLMHHTSGLNEWNTTFMLTGWERGTGSFGNDGILEIISKQKELIHPPGEEFNYLNANYNLLAIIIERVSKMPLDSFFQKNLFKPLGLSNTHWNDFEKNARHAFGYTGNSGTLRRANTTLKGLGPGGILTTPTDLVKWNHLYLSGGLGEKFLYLQLKQGRLNNGVTIPYAAGLSLGKYKGYTTVSHDGQGTGFTAFTESFPDMGLSFVVMSNDATLDAVSLCRQIADLFIHPIPSSVNRLNDGDIVLTPERLSQFTGWYKNTRTSAGLQLTLKNNRLVSNAGDTLQAVSPVSFKMKRGLLTFADSLRSMAKIITSAWYPDTVQLQPVAPPQLNKEAMAQYAGTYYSEALASTMVVKASNDTLYLKLLSEEIFALRPLYKDGFLSEPSLVGTSPTYIVYELQDGMVHGMRISLYRSRNNYFKKIR